MTTLAALIFAAAGPSGPELTPEDFKRIHSTLLAPERWETIPWRGNLLEARAQAAREKKPLFLWVMDAKPLGSV